MAFDRFFTDKIIEMEKMYVNYFKLEVSLKTSQKDTCFTPSSLNALTNQKYTA